MFKIDYYNKSYDRMSDNPADLIITNRILTIMTGEAY